MDTQSNIGKDILVNIILDRSGSMQSVKGNTIEGFNAYLTELRNDKETNYEVSLTQFDRDTAGHGIETLYVSRPLADCPLLDEHSFVPRGQTPLYDAVGSTIRTVEGQAKGRPVLTVIITDGQENASTEFTKDGVKKLIEEKKTSGWTFVFMGANIDSYAVGGAIGVAAVNTVNYAAGAEMPVFASLAASSIAYAQARRQTQQTHQAAGEQFFSDTLLQHGIGKSSSQEPKPDPKKKKEDQQGRHIPL